jgi:hypothetical protein
VVQEGLGFTGDLHNMQEGLKPEGRKEYKFVYGAGYELQPMDYGLHCSLKATARQSRPAQLLISYQKEGLPECIQQVHY